MMDMMDCMAWEMGLLVGILADADHVKHVFVK